MNELADFRMFCNQATDNQLEGIIEKETAGAEGGDPYREAYLEIALAVQDGRNT